MQRKHHHTGNLTHLVQREATKLARDYPPIANRWTQGETLPHLYDDLSRNLNYQNILGPSKKFGYSIISTALRLLLPEEHRERLEREHRKTHSETLYRDPHKGLSRLTPQQKATNARLSCQAQGIRPYSDEEITFVLNLCAQPEYRHQRGKHKGRLRWRKILDETNRAFNNHRHYTYFQVLITYHRTQRAQEQTTSSPP